MDAEAPYTTLEPKWQLVRGRVRTGDLANHPIVPTAKSARPRPPEAPVTERRSRRNPCSETCRRPTKKASPYFDGKS
jgi:hypothetical protein